MKLLFHCFLVFGQKDFYLDFTLMEISKQCIERSLCHMVLTTFIDYFNNSVLIGWSQSGREHRRNKKLSSHLADFGHKYFFDNKMLNKVGKNL